MATPSVPCTLSLSDTRVDWAAREKQPVRETPGGSAEIQIVGPGFITNLNPVACLKATGCVTGQSRLSIPSRSVFVKKMVAAYRSLRIFCRRCQNDYDFVVKRSFRVSAL